MVTLESLLVSFEPILQVFFSNSIGTLLRSINSANSVHSECGPGRRMVNRSHPGSRSGDTGAFW